MLLHESKKRNYASDIRPTSPWHRHQMEGFCPCQRRNAFLKRISLKALQQIAPSDKCNRYSPDLSSQIPIDSKPAPLPRSTNLSFLDLAFHSKTAGGMCKKCTNRRFSAHFYTWFDLGFYDFNTSFLTSSKPICV